MLSSVSSIIRKINIKIIVLTADNLQSALRAKQMMS